MLYSIFDVKKLSIFVIGILFLPGCGLFASSPHDNFLAILKDTTGQNIDDVPPVMLPHKEDLIDSKILSNGNIENKYKFRGACKYFLEVDPKSRKIVGSRYEGNNTECIMNP